MIKNDTILQEFEKELIKESKPDVMKNFRIVDAMYDEAVALGIIPLKDSLRVKNLVVRYLAGSINSSMTSGLHLCQQITDQLEHGIRVHWFLDKSIRRFHNRVPQAKIGHVHFAVNLLQPDPFLKKLPNLGSTFDIPLDSARQRHSDSP